MTTAPTQKTAKKAGLILLKIPYNWDTKLQAETIPVESREMAMVKVAEYQDNVKDNLARHYFLLVEGSIIPTSEWIDTHEFVYHA